MFLRPAILSALVFCGCAAPHRAAVTSHERRTYQGRSDGLVSLDTWRDTERGGGWFLLTDPTVSTISARHNNQSALGGGSVFSGGPMSLKVDPLTPAIIESGGTAAGKIIGEALKTAVGAPTLPPLRLP